MYILTEYIKTPEWRKKRSECFLLKGKACMKCGVLKGIHVHHATYERIGCENVATDLFPLCRYCHSTFHKLYDKNIISNTLAFLRTRGLPRLPKTNSILEKPYFVKQKKKKVKKFRKPKVKKQKIKKQKEPFVSTTYNKTQGKKYKFNEFKL